MTETVDTIIIGAGAVGLAIGRALSANCEVFVLEQHDHFGMETSSRNSEVIHAGLYYDKHFLKTRLCIEGRKKLYRYCSEHQIPFQQCGKLILAQDEAELEALKKIQHLHSNPADNPLRIINKQALKKLEPAVQAHAALLSPETGIIDSHQYMQQLLNDIHNNGSQVLFRQNVSEIEQSSHGFTLHINGSEPINCNTLINAAGLHAHKLSAMLTPESTPYVYYCKGNYLQYTGREKLSHLVYPLPTKNNTGLGIHATLNLEGQIRFGPDTHYIDNIDYNVSPELIPAFAQSIQRYLPSIQASELEPAYTGIRPKLYRQGEQATDFLIQSEKQHGIKSLIQLFGIESPGLTASLAIADYIENLLQT